jgi:hypothetical protein
MCGLACSLPRPLGAQVDSTFHETTPRWVAHFTSASANMLLSALTAGVAQELKGGSFRDGFTRGALGGLIIYGGKRISIESFAGAGLIGREVASVGASVVRNAADGLGSFERLVLPVGVIRIYRHPKPGNKWQAKIDAVALGQTIYGVVERELVFDASKSFSSGMAVFRTRNRILDLGDEHAAGVTNAGVIFLSDVPLWGQELLQRAFAHERVHSLQMDQLFLTLNDPYDDVLLRYLPLGDRVNRWVDINVTTEFLRLLNMAIDKHGDRPWELEAIYLTR